MKCKYLGLLASAGFAALLFTAGTANAGPVPEPVPVPPPPKVTGGGQILTATGLATFGFNAQPVKGREDLFINAKGNFNYVSHADLHINGSVDHIEVVLDLDGNPTSTVLFSGTWGTGGTFIVTVEDNGEPGSADKIGITVNDLTEAGHDVISQGNIQFHKSK